MERLQKQSNNQAMNLGFSPYNNTTVLSVCCLLAELLFKIECENNFVGFSYKKLILI